MLSHGLLLARQAAAQGDARLAREALSVASAVPTTPTWHSPVGPVLIVRAADCHVGHHGVYQSTPYLLSTAALLASPSELGEWVVTALGRIAQAGLTEILTAWPCVVMLLRDATEQVDSMSSYSLLGIGGTVYVDRTSGPLGSLLFAEAYMHEAAHCWLNDAFRALEVRLPLEPMHYSPWKQTLRPPFGILHAVFAFSTLMRLFRAIVDAPQSLEVERAYCRARLTQHKEQLTQAGTAFEEVVALITCAALRERLALAVRRALRPESW